MLVLTRKASEGLNIGTPLGVMSVDVVEVGDKSIVIEVEMENVVGFHHTIPLTIGDSRPLHYKCFDLKISAVSRSGGGVRLGIKAPRHITVLRKEIIPAA